MSSVEQFIYILEYYFTVVQDKEKKHEFEANLQRAKAIL